MLVHQKNKSFLFIFFTLFFGYLFAFFLYFKNLSPFLVSHPFFANFIFALISFNSVFIVKSLIYRELFWEKYFLKICLDSKILLVIYSVFLIEVLVFLFDIFLPGIYFSRQLEVLLAKYSLLFDEAKLSIFKKFASDFSVEYFWALNLFVGIIVGMTSGAIFYFLEMIGWVGLLYDEFKKIGIFKAGIYVGFWWGMFYIPFVFLGFFGKNSHLINAFLILSWHILITPILFFIREKTDSLLYVSLFLGILNATYFLATFFVVGANDIIIGVKGVCGILILGICNILLFVIKKDVFKKFMG